jgi:small conductance mechanosensitive channel
LENVEQVSENITSTLADNIAETLNISNTLVEKIIAFGGKILVAAIILLLGLIAMRIILRFTKRAMTKANVESIIRNYITVCIKTIVWVILIISILTILGVPTTSLIALISAAGVAIALALQDSLSNLAGGLLIIVNKPFSKGNLIEAQGVTGIVEEIHLMNCKLHTVQNKDIVIPNGILFNGTIVNCSSSGCRRIDVSVSVSYDTDLAKAKAALLKIAEANEKIMDSPLPTVGVAELGDSAIQIDFLVWCDTKDYWDVYYGVREDVINAFRRENIEIPYPQLDVKIKENKQD